MLPIKWNTVLLRTLYIGWVIVSKILAQLQDNFADGNPEHVAQFLIEYEEDAAEMCHQVTSATWGFTTNLTEYSRNKMNELISLNAKFERSSWRKASSFKWTHSLDTTSRRKLKLVSSKRHCALSDPQFAELQQLIADMKNTYSKARICTFHKSTLATCELSLDPDANKILAYSRDYEEQLHVWKNWRDAVGPAIKSRFVRYVELSNKASRLLGFNDAAQEEQLIYESQDLESELAEAWTVVMPLYKQLYTYVRRHLVQYYGAHRIHPDGPIPAHLLGNMWGQSWKNIIDLVLPFDGKRKVDITGELLRQGYTPHRMYQVAEEFFTSLGMKAMPVEFWRYSIFERPNDRQIACKSSAWDFCNGRDYRIKQCTEITMDSFFAAHHEMTHIQYYLQYSSQPYIFRDGANPGFHEAMSDMILLSVSTPKHLHRIGLLNNITDDYETTIDFLMEMALDKVAYLPFAYLVDLWRWSIFKDGTNEMNHRWWDLRLRYQGLIPSVKRTEDDFDPASKYHIISDLPYTRYFVSLILQFQIYEGLCNAIGHTGTLHTCDIYRSREAGRILSEMMSMGASQPWREILKTVTIDHTNRLNGRSIIEYFKPLHTWLEIQNRYESTIGWKNLAQEKQEPLQNRSNTTNNYMLIILIISIGNYIISYN